MCLPEAGAPQRGKGAGPSVLRVLSARACKLPSAPVLRQVFLHYDSLPAVVMQYLVSWHSSRP